MLHCHFDEAFLIGQEHIEGARMSIKGFWGPANSNHNSTPTFLLAEWISSAFFVWRNQTCKFGTRNTWAKANKIYFYVASKIVLIGIWRSSGMENLISKTCQGLTSTHDVVPEEWSSEPQRQHQQVAGEAWKQLREASGVGAEVGEGSCYQHAMRVETQDVVVSGVQVGCLHQLRGQQWTNGPHLI